MSFLVANCDYCQTKKMTFQVKGFNKATSLEWHVFSICSECGYPTVFKLVRVGAPLGISEMLQKAQDVSGLKSLNLSLYFNVINKIIPPNNEVVPCPQHVPENIKTVFDEAAICLSIDCYTSSGAMFRLCLDITTKELLKTWLEDNTDPNIQPNAAQKDKLYNRIEFLIQKNVIPPDLKEYAHHIRLDGNEAAHEGSTEKQDAEDLLDFTELFLERIYTMKKQLELAQERRLARRM